MSEFGDITEHQQVRTVEYIQCVWTEHGNLLRQWIVQK